MPAHCAGCRRPLGICEVTYLVEHEDGADEWCEACDAGLPETLRPSLGFVPSLLRSVARGEVERTRARMNERREPDDFAPIFDGGTTLYRPLNRSQRVTWPEVDRRAHPANNVRPLVERRGPRASRFNDLETTR